MLERLRTRFRRDQAGQVKTGRVGLRERPGPAASAANLRTVPARDAAPQDAATSSGGGVRSIAPGDAFTPTRPTAGRRQLIGRQAELERVLLALRDEKAHVVLYAERGSGKTSLSNLVIETLRRSGVIVARCTCEAASSFDAVIRGLMRDVPEALLAAPAEGSSGEGCEAALPPREVQPRDVATLISRLACRSLVCVVDEFDRVEDDTMRTQLADTIKQVSDRGVPLSFMIVGVSENLDEILGRHPSVQRNVAPFHMPLLSDEAVAGLLIRGANAIGLVIPPSLIVQVTTIARGMPYMAQLLGLRIAQFAYLRGERRVTEDDLAAVVERLLLDARPAVVARYASLTDGGQDTETVTALRQIATADHDPWGRLAVTFGTAAVTIGGRVIAPQCWLRLQAAGVLRPSDAEPGLVTFNDRDLLNQVLLLAARDGTLLDGVDEGGRALGGANARWPHRALASG